MKVKDLENSPLLTSENTAIEGPENPPENSPDGIGENQKCFHPLIAIIIVLVVFLITILGIVVFVKNGETETDALKVCNTNECLTLSTAMLNWQNTAIDPCDDFYEYTCGRYSVHSGNEGTRIVEKELIVRRLITELVHKNKSSTSKSEKTVKKLYWKCMELKNEEYVKANEKAIYQEIFGNIRKIGHWPTAEGLDWKNETFDMSDMLANMAHLHMREYGLFEFQLFEHPSKNTVKQLVIVPPSTKSKLPKDQMVEMCQNLLLHNGCAHQKEQLSADLQKFFDLDYRLRRHIPIEWGVPETSYSDIQNRLPTIGFDKIAEKLLAPGGNWTSLRSKIRSRKFAPFYVGNDTIGQIIQETDARDMANFLIFKYIEFSYPFATLRKQVIEPRPCDELVINVLPRASLRLFVRNYFEHANLQIAEQMVEDIKETYVEMFGASTWLDESTKKFAIEKVEKMKSMIGYTKDYQEKGRLDAIFESLPVHPDDSFYALFTKIQRFRTEQLMGYILTDDAMLNPIDMLVVANAFYYPLKNALNILIPFLDKPLFEASYPSYVNSAGVGRVLAHEIGHAFDTHGRAANYNGTVGRWWTIGDDREYREKVKCLVAQYERFIDPDHGTSLNGTQVLNEMIADHLGTQAAWKTYKKMNLTDQNRLFKFEQKSFDELYFHVAALDFCAPPDKNHVSKRKEFKHPQSRYRVNAVFQNLPAFAETFKCPKGSNMNPENRCTLF